MWERETVSRGLAWYLALWTLCGGDISLANPAVGGLVNGSFETGDLRGWTRSAFQDRDGHDPIFGGPNFTTFLAAKSAAPLHADTNGVETSQTDAFDYYSPPIPSPAISPANGKYFAFVSDLMETDGYGSLQFL